MMTGVKESVALVRKWLEFHHPLTYPVTVAWRKRLHFEAGDTEGMRGVTQEVRERGLFAYCYTHKKRSYIFLSERRCDSVAIATETLVHEWAHLLDARHPRREIHRECEGHDDSFYLTFGKLMQHLHGTAVFEDNKEGGPALGLCNIY